MRPACIFLACFLGAGCADHDPDPEPISTSDPDCEALEQAARRGQHCDPALAGLADSLARNPDPTECRKVARRLLTPSSPTSPIKSLYDELQAAESPLSPAERRSLLTLPLPGFVTVVPDVPHEPGRPRTAATVNGQNVDPDQRGRLRASLHPGSHDFEIRHAGESTHYCVSVDRCETLALTAHGHKLASHPRVRRGTCFPTAQPPPTPR